MTIDLTDVPALTLQQPWAHAITHHGKDVENRSWPAPASVSNLLIHAGKRWDQVGAEFLDARHVVVDRASAPLGAIVAVADLAWCCDNAMRFAMCACSTWAMPGQYHWNLANVRVLAEPVPCTGRLGLWRPSTDVLAQVAASLGGAR